MLTYYKCEIKREPSATVSVTVYQRKDSQTDWHQMKKKHCRNFDRAQDIAEQEKKARGATDYAWQTVIDTREAIQ